MKTSSIWDDVSKKAWQKVPVPWRPDKIDLAVYTIFIIYHGFFSKRPVLLLGATQELRRILSFLKIRYDLVDTSPHMEKITKPSKKDSIRHFFKARWEEYCPQDEHSLVAGDLILNLCSQENVKKILKNHHKKPLIFRTRMPTIFSCKKTIEFTKEVLSENKLSGVGLFYSLLANTQTITLVFRKTEEESLSLIFQEQENKRKNLFEDVYLKHSPEYFLHEKEFLKAALRKDKRGIYFERKHLGYVDDFCFLIQTKQQSEI